MSDDVDISEVPRPKVVIKRASDEPKVEYAGLLANHGWLDWDLEAYMTGDERRYVVSSYYGQVVVDGTKEGALGRLDAIIREIENVKNVIREHQ